MYVPVTTEDFDTWIKAESRTFETRCDVIIGNTTYRLSGSGLGGDIISMQWNNVVCSNDGLQIGTSCMDEFRMEYRNNGIPSLMNSEIHPYVGLVIPHENTGDVTVWIPLGVFYVTNTETNDDGRTYSITAYDGMQKFMKNINWAEIGVEFPINAWTLLETIASHFNVTLSFDPLAYDLLSSDEYTLTTSDDYTLQSVSEADTNRDTYLDEPLEGTFRDYIGWIAGLVGANAHMGREGDLVIYRYTDHGYSIGRNVQHMGGAKINFGGAVTYTAIVSGTESDPVYSASYTGNAITYTNPYITTEELEKVCDTLIGEDGITVTPCNVEWRSDPRIDAGDIVSVEGSDGNFYSVYVMERTVTITGGLSETLNCYGETEVQKALNTSPLSTKLANIEKKANDASSMAEKAADYINNTKGTFRWIDNGDDTNGGYTIYADSGYAFLRCTAGGIGLSDDGGQTYNNAMTPDGIVATAITTGEMSADRIRGGTLQLGGYNDVSGVAQIYDENEVLRIELNKDGITAQNRQSVSGSYYTFTTQLQMAQLYFYQDGSPLFGLFPVYSQQNNIGHGSLGCYQSFYVVTGAGGGVGARFAGGGGITEDGQDFHAIWYFGHPMYVNGSLTVSGTKSRSVNTKDYGERLLYAYETPSPMFGDVGEGEIAEDGYAYILIEPMFAQTIQSDSYHVFITSYSEDDVKVVERTPTHFVCKGTQGTKFSWMLMAKQKGYEVERLEEIDSVNFTTPQENYGGVNR